MGVAGRATETRKMMMEDGLEVGPLVIYLHAELRLAVRGIVKVEPGANLSCLTFVCVALEDPANV
jgi:hypothetical protein